MKCPHCGTEYEIIDSNQIDWDEEEMTMYLHLWCPKCQRTSGCWEVYKLIRQTLDEVSTS